MILPIIVYPIITLLSIYATAWCNRNNYSACIIFFFTTILSFSIGVTNTPLSYGLSMVTALGAFVIYDAVLVLDRLFLFNITREGIADFISPIRPYIYLVYGINALILFALIIRYVFQIDY